MFGLLAFFLPGITLLTLVLLFGAYALVDGVFNVIAFFRLMSHHWGCSLKGWPESLLVSVCVASDYGGRVAVPDCGLGDLHRSV